MVIGLMGTVHKEKGSDQVDEKQCDRGGDSWSRRHQQADWTSDGLSRLNEKHEDSCQRQDQDHGILRPDESDVDVLPRKWRQKMDSVCPFDFKRIEGQVEYSICTE